MSIIQAIILGIVQGLTEFIPVSSSGHLLLVQRAMGVTETGLTFDVALHIGTLLALIIFFYNDVVLLIKAIFVKTEKSRLAWLWVYATIPAAVIGFLLESAAESSFRSIALVSINLAVFGLVMLYSESFSKRYRTPTSLSNISTKQALTMGFAQAASVVPGVSRSGSTITAGLFMGMDRIAATRFSFLLGIPITAGAIAKVLLKQTAFTHINQELAVFIVGVLVAFITGVIAIKFMLKYLAKHSLSVFAYYRIALAAAVLIVIYSR